MTSRRLQSIISKLRSKLALLVVVSAAVLVLTPLPVAAQLSISSTRYIVIDADSGEVFAEEDSTAKVAIASLTKMFTTIEALERGSLDQLILTHESDLFDANSTTMGFGPGETFTLLDLLYGMMLPSGNDAAHAVARAIGYQEGDSDEVAVNRFIGYMNDRVAAMGLADTHLTNPTGWGEEGHYSTAADVAAFAMYALRYPTFLELISAVDYTTTNGYYLTNTNRLLTGYGSLIGGKTGYDDDSGYCLFEIAERDGSTMISVTLDGVAPDIWYEDNVQLLEHGFAAKQERQAAALPISEPQLSFRDPDAVVIQANAVAGASLGVPTDALASQNATASDDQNLAQQDVTEPASNDNSRSLAGPLIAALFGIAVVAAGIVWYLTSRRPPEEADEV